MKKLLVWHKRCALVAFIPFIVWALSGLLHPAMSHFAAPKNPVKESVPRFSIPEHYVPLAQVLNEYQIHAFNHLRLVNFQNELYYQMRFKASPQQGHFIYRYFSVANGQEAHFSTEQYSAELAQNWSSQDVLAVDRIDEFSPRYPEVNRVLPAYRAHLADGSFLYIDPQLTRVIAHTTLLREDLMYWFKQLHTFEFLGGNHAVWKLTLMLVLMVCVLLTAIFGLIMYSMLWSRIKPSKWTAPKRHRVVALLVSLPLLGFSTSAIHVIVDKFYPESFRTIEPANSLLTANLSHDPIAALIQSKGNQVGLVSVQDELYSQIEHRNKNTLTLSYWQHHASEVTDTEIAKDMIAVALGYTGNVVENTWITRFGPTYGFINKRLPVTQITLDSLPDTPVSVETRSGYIASVYTPWQQARSWHFGNLHKYHFLNPIGKELRDVLITLLILGVSLSAVLGLWLSVSRRRRRAASKLSPTVITS